MEILLNECFHLFRSNRHTSFGHTIINISKHIRFKAISNVTVLNIFPEFVATY